jgi:NAD(P)-dependent dehydrogenase (short-subunit alcohol dehydrogenase family)
MSNTIFITGASTGLGKATAKLFAQKGWHVIATMRKPENEKELSSMENVTVLALDVTNAQQVNEVVNKAVSITNIDVVFNNAGYGLVGPLEGATDEQLTQQINTNLLGVIRVTKAFIPHFRKNGKGLFISTTSIGGLVTFPLNSIYHATKWALEGWSESMAFELAPFGIGIKTVSPGGITTDFAGRSLDMANHEAYSAIVKKVWDTFSDPERSKNYSTAEQIAAIVYEAATDGKNKLRYVAGNDAKVLYEQRLKVGDEIFREEIRKNFMG